MPRVLKGLNELAKAYIAEGIRAGMLRRIQVQPCDHRVKAASYNVRVMTKSDKDLGTHLIGTAKFTKDGYLKGESEEGIPVDRVVYCANPCCEKVFELVWRFKGKAFGLVM